MTDERSTTTAVDGSKHNGPGIRGSGAAHFFNH